MGFFDTPLRLISVKQKENDLLWQDLSAQEKYHAEKRNDELNTKGKRPGSGCIYNPDAAADERYVSRCDRHSDE